MTEKTRRKMVLSALMDSLRIMEDRPIKDGFFQDAQLIQMHIGVAQLKVLGDIANAIEQLVPQQPEPNNEKQQSTASPTADPEVERAAQQVAALFGVKL